MTVDEERGPGQQTGVHAHTFAGIGFNEDEALPPFAITFGFGFELFQKRFLELQDFLNVHAGDEGLGCGDVSVGQENVLELVVAGGQDGSAFVDFGRVEQIEHRKMLDGEDAVHAFEAQAAFAIQEVGDVSLLESSLFGQAETGQVAFFDAFPESFTQVFLQHSEFHNPEYSTRYSNALNQNGFPQLCWYNNLD